MKAAVLWGALCCEMGMAVCGASRPKPVVVRPDGKCCEDCRGTGVITHGDGHTTPCPCPPACACKKKKSTTPAVTERVIPCEDEYCPLPQYRQQPKRIIRYR